MSASPNEIVVVFVCSAPELRWQRRGESAGVLVRCAHRHKQPVRTAVQGHTVEENGEWQ